MKFLIYALSALLATSIAEAKDFTVGDLTISQPVSHAMVAGAEVGDGFFKVTNHGNVPDKLIAASSERASKVQLHKMTIENNVMLMREVKDGLDIPAGQTVDLAPHYHMMFMNPAKPFKQGEKIHATLTFQRAGTIDVVFEVGRLAGPLTPGDASNSESMDMGDMKMPDTNMSK